MARLSAFREIIRTTLSIISIVGFGLLATGCGKATNNRVNTITLHVWRLNQDVDPLRDIFAQFHDDHPSVEIIYSKHTEDTYELDALASLASKEGPDIWSIPNDWIGDETDRLLPLPNSFFWPDGATNGPAPADALKSIYPAGINEQILQPDGTVIGAPTNVDALQLYYNPTLFNDAAQEYSDSFGDNPDDAAIQIRNQLLSAPATTWKDLLDQVKAINKRDSSGQLVRSGIALGTANNIPDASDILQLLMLQNGADIISADHQRALFGVQKTTPSGGSVRPGQNALDFYTSFSNPKKDNYSWNPSMPPALDAFAQGKVAMVIAYTDFGDQLKDKYPQFEFNKTAVPQISTDQAPVNFIRFSVETVTKINANANASFALLSKYAKNDGLSNLANEAGLQSPLLSDLTTAANDSNNQNNFVAKEILTGQATYKLKRTQFDQAMLQMITDVSQTGLPSAGALDQATDTINKLLAPPSQPTPTPISNQ